MIDEWTPFRMSSLLRVFYFVCFFARLTSNLTLSVSCRQISSKVDRCYKLGRMMCVFNRILSHQITPAAFKWFTSCRLILWVRGPALNTINDSARLSCLEDMWVMVLGACRRLRLWRCHAPKLLLPSPNKWKLILQMGAQKEKKKKYHHMDLDLWDPRVWPTWFLWLFVAFSVPTAERVETLHNLDEWGGGWFGYC